MSRAEKIKVALRLRPLNQREQDERDPVIWKTVNNAIHLKQRWQDYLTNQKKLTHPLKSYTYNHCFLSQQSNKTIYKTLVKDIVAASLQGYNGTVFAYGQTGSGKTYTMLGKNSAELDIIFESNNYVPDRKSIIQTRNYSLEHIKPYIQQINSQIDQCDGIINLALRKLFRLIEGREDKVFNLKFSYMEIYNEQIFDLLIDWNHQPEPLQVIEDPVKGFQVKNLSEHSAVCIEQVGNLLNKGELNRRYAVTSMNHHSSRSHTIFKITVTGAQMSLQQGDVITEGVINFVDLAGSERLGNIKEATNPLETLVLSRPKTSRKKIKKNTLKDGQNNERLLIEGKHINTSLFYLCQVITKLAEKSNTKEIHIPYRNSNLTKILAPSLGGNSLTCVICTATPTLSQFELTLGTLRFAGTANTVTNQIMANVQTNKALELQHSYLRDIEIMKKRLLDQETIGSVKLGESIKVQRVLEARISKLTRMLFNRPIQQLENRQDQNEFWNQQTGIIRIDQRLDQQMYLGNNQYSERGELALKRMFQMRQEQIVQDQTIAKLKQKLQKLKKSIIQCQDDKQTINQECENLQQSYSQKLEYQQERQIEVDLLQKRVKLLQNVNNIENIDDEEIDDLQKYFWKCLKLVKQAKIERKYERQFGVLKERN